jgi:hypothetical protein
VTIEDEVFIGHDATFINDNYPRTTNSASPQLSCKRGRRLDAVGDHAGPSRSVTAPR